MKRDLVLETPQVHLSGVLRSAPAWACTLAAVSILAFHWKTAASIVAIWIRSETYTHGFLVIPICIWLAWRMRASLLITPAKPWWPGIALVTLATALWVVASAADALGLGQFALAFMLQAAIVTIIGPRLARALAFPIMFLLFAVPFGEVFIPTMIDWTADFTVAAIRLSGVPVYRDANLFVIPTGAWSVVEACSGVRYVIASTMVGTLFAATAYRSWRRRALFLGASVLVPIVANWVRAYLIVMLGHLSNNRLAVGVDHIIYGWLFFGVVMLLLFWVGSLWQQDASPAPAVAVDADVGRRVSLDRPASRYFVASVACVVIAASALPLAGAIGRASGSAAPSLPPIDAADGWSAATPPITDWKPNFSGQAATLAQVFSKGEWRAGIDIEYYRGQTRGRELITSGNVLVVPWDVHWKKTASRNASIGWDGASRNVSHVELANGETRLDVLSMYWVDGRITSSAPIGKALQAWSRLRGHGDDAALVVLYVRSAAGRSDAPQALRDFAAAMMPGIARTLRAARRSGL
jgi:exosortase A